MLGRPKPTLTEGDTRDGADEMSPLRRRMIDDMMIRNLSLAASNPFEAELI